MRGAAILDLIVTDKEELVAVVDLMGSLGVGGDDSILESVIEKRRKAGQKIGRK